MIRRTVQSFFLAFQNIRSNFFHTFLSVLGIVIGVGALVSILSLIDGMEEFAKNQIATTTSLNMISVSTNPFIKKDGITVRKDSVTLIDFDQYQSIQSRLSKPASVYIFQREARIISVEGDTSSVAAQITSVAGLKPDSLLAGRSLTPHDLSDKKTVTVLTESLAKALAGGGKIETLLGKEIKINGHKLTVVGIIQLKFAPGSELFMPFTLVDLTGLKRNLAQMVVEADHIEDVNALKRDIESYLMKQFGAKHDFTVATNSLRVKQAEQGFFLFRVIMGLIVGISVVVGGIGVMNVLLISVTERTTEIGIRKAVGASNRDIVLLFLSESITVSAFGSLLGLIFGVLFTMAVIPIVKAITKIPFQANYTVNTLLIISVIAVVVGIIFGTYPAIRASRLDPVDAIRHE